MSEYSQQLFEFTRVAGKSVQVGFDEPAVTSDAGALLVAGVLRRNTLLAAIARCIADGRDPERRRYSVEWLLRQRLAQICCAYFTADASDTLRHDPAMIVAAGGAPGESQLASQPTISRLENSLTKRQLLRIGYAFVDHYIGSFATPPKMVVLDMDPTAITTYGQQELGLFNAHEDEYCLMPFHVYDGLTGQLIAVAIRPGKSPAADEILAVLRRIAKRLKAAWPHTRIVFRADSHHTKPAVMDWLESQGLDYVTGLGPNALLDKQFRDTIEGAKKAYKRLGQEVTRYAHGDYQAGSWSRPRRVVCRVLASHRGVDTRYIVTSFQRTSERYLYETVYCGRGNVELMIKDHKRDLGGDHASCHKATANQFRLFLHAAAYTILHRIRNLLTDQQLAKARFSTIMLRLLKVGARVAIGRRHIRFHLPATFAYKDQFLHLLGIAPRPAPD